MVVSQSYARIFFRNCVSTYVSVQHDVMNCLCLYIVALFAVLIWHAKYIELCTAEAKYTQLRQMSASVIF